jgi:hypothetical protein
MYAGVSSIKKASIRIISTLIRVGQPIFDHKIQSKHAHQHRLQKSMLTAGGMSLPSEVRGLVCFRLWLGWAQMTKKVHPP